MGFLVGLRVTAGAGHHLDENVRQMDFDGGDSEGDLAHYPSTKRYLVANLNPFPSISNKMGEFMMFSICLPKEFFGTAPEARRG